MPGARGGMNPPLHLRQRSGALPLKRAAEPNSSSMRSNWLYLAMRSVREAEPVLICPAPVATARSAMNVSSVSPERCEMIELYPALRASSIASIVSVTLPIWLSLINMALAMPSLIPRDNRSVLVTNRSSPTSWIFLGPNAETGFLDSGPANPAGPPLGMTEGEGVLLPTLWVSVFQPDQSSSAIPSSIETMGYFSTQLVQYAAISGEVCADLSDFLKTYFPLGFS